jgi:hypothetical protein
LFRRSLASTARKDYLLAMGIRRIVRLKSRQWAWFFGLWIAGLAVTLAVAYLLRWLIAVG